MPILAHAQSLKFTIILTGKEKGLASNSNGPVERIQWKYLTTEFQLWGLGSQVGVKLGKWVMLVSEHPCIDAHHVQPFNLIIPSQIDAPAD